MGMITRTGDIVSDGSIIFREYIWLDNLGNIRSKTWIGERQYVQKEADPQAGVISLEPIAPAEWSADGSNTGQALPEDSDIILNPVLWTTDPLKEVDELVICEVLDTEEDEDELVRVPHWNNERALLIDTINQLAPSTQPWIGFEQEYYLADALTGEKLGGDTDSHYCGVNIGVGHVLGNKVAIEHMKACGRMLAGKNAEVSTGQWEFQIEKQAPLQACDWLILCRYVLMRIAEKHGLIVILDPKPYPEQGSGCHTNLSTAETRGEIENENSWEWIQDTAQKLVEAHQELVDPELGYYGYGIEKRLTGDSETCSMDNPHYGVGDRTAAVRIPKSTALKKKGHIEDRRPCANIDPYTVCRKLLEITCLPQENEG
jgi:glutamine synthetase